MKTKKKTISPEALAAAQTQLDEVRRAFDGVARLKPIERKRNLKLRRGGHQIVPLLAYVADKYSVMGPEISGAALSDAFEYARSLEPLVSAATELLAALKDEQFHANGDLWRSSISIYGMLRKVAETHPEVATEMAPAVEWFRVRARGGKHAKAANTTSGRAGDGDDVGVREAARSTPETKGGAGGEGDASRAFATGDPAGSAGR